jgi:hypothetical protein
MQYIILWLRFSKIEAIVNWYNGLKEAYQMSNVNKMASDVPSVITTNTRGTFKLVFYSRQVL